MILDFSSNEAHSTPIPVHMMGFLFTKGKKARAFRAKAAVFDVTKEGKGAGGRVWGGGALGLVVFGARLPVCS